MRMTYSKKRNEYKNTYYSLEVQIIGRAITKEQFETIKNSMDSIANILSDRIDREIKKSK